MDNTSQKSINWHSEILSLQTKKALDFLSKEKWFKKSEWYLAGGTALALQTGIRKSYDLDFFTTNKDFDEKKLISRFVENLDWKVEIEEKNTIYGELFDSKVSFIAYPFFVPLQKKIKYGFISVLQPVDIAVMKIIAISQRGRKRDFFDLYWCANNIEPLKQTVKRLKKQYPAVAHDYHHILKSLIYFEDAESDPEPNICFVSDWNEVKKFFKKEIPRITTEIIGLH